MVALKYLLARLREPSTYAGLAAIAAAIGHPGGGELISQIGQMAVAIFGGAAVLISGDPKQ